MSAIVLPCHNPATQITFHLPSVEKVSIQIFSIKGELVQTLLNGVLLQAGEHNVNFDGANLANELKVIISEAV